MNMRTVFTLLLWGVIAFLLVRACNPESTAPSDQGSLDFHAEDFSVPSGEEQTFVLENDVLWSEWTSIGAACLEVRMKNHFVEVGSNEWLTVFSAVADMPPPAGSPPSSIHYRKRLGLRMVEAGEVLGKSLDATNWTADFRSGSSRLVFETKTPSGVVVRKNISLADGLYHFDVHVSANSTLRETAGKNLALRIGTGGGMLAEQDTFYRNPYVAAALTEYGEVEEFEIHYPDGDLPERRDMAARWTGEIPYVLEGSKYFFNFIQALDKPFRGAVAEVLWDEAAREEAVFQGLTPEIREKYQAVGIAEWDWRKKNPSSWPTGADLASTVGLSNLETQGVLADLRRRMQVASAGEFWNKASISGAFSLHLNLPEDPAEGQHFQWYLGPKDPAILAAYGAAASSADFADFGSSFFYKLFLTPYTAPAIMGILKFFQSFVGNWGVAIILLTMLVRGSLMPLNRKSQLKMAEYQVKMQRVKPLMEAINKRYGKDPKRKQQETMKLYKEHKISPPLGGCLPILIQMPIFIGLFAALRSSILLRQQGFVGWITDLSRPDAMIDFHGPLVDVFLLRSVTSLNVLPILMVVLWVIHQKSMPKQADPQQAQMQKMMTWMPVLFGIMLYNYAAGLSLYMIVSSGIGIFEAKVIKKKWPVPVPVSSADGKKSK